MKRYRICPDDMEEIYWEDKDGEWVKHDDAQKEIEKRDNRIDKLRLIIKEMIEG